MPFHPNIWAFSCLTGRQEPYLAFRSLKVLVFPGVLLLCYSGVSSAPGSPGSPGALGAHKSDQEEAAVL